MNVASLDMIAGVLTGLVALFLFLIHSMVVPAHAKWITVPIEVRIGILAFGTVLMVRSVNLIALSGEPIDQPGHVNWEGVLVAVTLFYLISTTAMWISREFKARSERIHQAARAARQPLLHR